MKKYTVLSVLAMACLSMQAAELTGTRFAGYTTCAVPENGFSILAVPFSGSDATGFIQANISLDDLISKNELTDGDRLIAFDEATTNYYYYELTDGVWVPLEVSAIGTNYLNKIEIIKGPELSTVTKPQGYAFWLKTKNATTAYLQGVVNTNEASVAVAADSFTLIGNALPTALDLNDSAFTNANNWCTPYDPVAGPGDEIHVANGSSYLRNVFIEGAWKNSTTHAPSDPIPAGSGVWYLRRGTGQTLKVK